MGRAKEHWMEMQEEWANRRLASILGITYEELEELEWEVESDHSEDGLIYGYRIEFYGEENKDILNKIERLEDGCRVYLSQWEYEDSNEEGELEWDIISSDQLKVFNAHLSSVENILNVTVSQNDEFNLLVMLHAHVIASVEQYISSTFIHQVTNSDLLTRKLIESDPEFGNRKFTLDKIYLKQEELKVTVASYLKSLIYHDMKKVKPMYKSVLGYDFGDIGWLFKAITLRHDCVHRAGFTKEGVKVAITAEDIRVLTESCRALVSGVDAHISQI